MRQIIGSVVGFVVVIAVTAVALYAVVRGVEKDPAVVGSFVTVVGGLITVEVSRTRQRQSDLLQSHRAEMQDVYINLVTNFSTTKPNLDFLATFQRKFIVHGPTEVVKAWLAFARAQPAEEDFSTENPAWLLMYERVLFVIRADLGHDNKGLEPGDLLRLYVTDADDFIKRSDTSRHQPG